ncbi:hypothetical protein ACET3Z_031602 [Daucus carota]
MVLENKKIPRAEKQDNNKFIPFVIILLFSSSSMPLVVSEIDESTLPLSSHAPIVSSYNEKIRPLLDAIDKLRNLKVVQEGIQLPTIVVVGDQSSGKSSVLESLAGISLPRGQARKLVQIQATIISKCLPEIVKKINTKLNGNVLELNKLPQKLSTIAEAMTVFMRILEFSKESLNKVLVRGEFEEYPDNKNMHCTARLAEMLDKFSQELKNSSEKLSKEKFLLDEIFVLEETKSVALPNFLPRSAFVSLLQVKVKKISKIPVNFVAEVWDYIKMVVEEILMNHCENYPQVQSSIKRAVSNQINKLKEQSTSRVMEIIEMEEIADYTCDPEYMAVWSKFMTSRDAFKESFRDVHSTIVNIKGFGKIDVGHVRDHPGVRDQAFDLKMRLTAYWNIVLKRMVDSIALHLLLALKKLVNQGMEEEIVKEVLSQSGGIERLLVEAPLVATKRARLNQSIGLLKESRDVLAKIIDRVAIADE